MSGNIKQVSITFVLSRAFQRKSDGFIDIFDLVENSPLGICESYVNLENGKSQFCHVISEEPVHRFIFGDKPASVDINEDGLFRAVLTKIDIHLVSGIVIVNVTDVFYLGYFFWQARKIKLTDIGLKCYLSGFFHYPVDHAGAPLCQIDFDRKYLLSLGSLFSLTNSILYPSFL